ncbi:MAG: Gfo/Idh/MocA family oxidoreductase [Firmicutes bacterium]|nr:Gfo/Idh/MocA family oxidoreductase [Bacillota bacterium]
MIGVALVGLGDWSEVLAQQIARSSRVRLISVFARREQRRADFARMYGCKAAGSYEELLQDPEVQGVILATPNSVHEEQIRLAAEFGKSVLVEKPISASIEQAKRISEIAAENSIVIAVGHNSRRRPESRMLKQLITEGRIGESVMVEGTFSHDRGLRLRAGEWRWAREECPTGPLIQLGIHHADTLHYLFGPVRSVFGMQKRLHSAADIDDTTVTVFEFESGCLGYIGSSYATAATYRIVVYGTRGQLFYDDSLGFFKVDVSGGAERIKISVPKQSVAASLLEEIDEFADCISQRRQPEVTVQDGLRAVALVAAAELSAREGRLVSIHEVLNAPR